MASPGSVLFSLQSKLIGAFVLVTLAALVLAGSIFVFVRRGEQEQQELDHVIAASPVIYGQFSVLRERDADESLLAEFVDAAATEFDVRILLVDRTDGTVASDSDDGLTGEQLRLRDVEAQVTGQGPYRPYLSWHPESDTPGDGLVLLTSLPSRSERFRRFPAFSADLYWLVLAVPESTITRAWLGLLPGLGAAAAIALPAAALLGLLVARYITRPLQQLTVASQRMAEGTFDVRVSVDRRDEVGQLAHAFSTMARRVGEAHTQMRALVANVSHDLKTPITSILGFAQALRDGRAEDEAEVRRMGGIIYDESSRLTARLNDLLFLSELESGQALLQRDEIDLRRLIGGVAQRIEADAAGRNLRLSVELAGGVTVSADGPKLERAVENLLDNARKHAPSGSEITVRTYVEPGYAYIEVANPPGDLSDEELPRLFERFYRRDRTRGQGGDAAGSGLGLPIARDLAELHGGTLDASLRDGQIVFTIKLPLRG